MLPHICLDYRISYIMVFQTGGANLLRFPSTLFTLTLFSYQIFVLYGLMF